MDSFSNPYAALIATFNQVSPLESKDDLEDPQHIADDDLLLWANAQFTYDIPPGVGIYEDDMGVKLAMSQQQFQQTQQQQQQQQQSSFQQQQTSQGQQQHSIQYQSSDIQHQLQFDAIHRYLENNSEDPRTSLSVVERSRQRNPVNTSSSTGPSQSQVTSSIPYSGLSAIYPHGHNELSQFSSAPTTSATTTAEPISPAAARLLRQQPFLTLQHQHQQFSATSTPLSSPTTMSSFHQLQINPQAPIVSPKPSDDVPTAKRSIAARSEGVKSPVSSSPVSNSIFSDSKSKPEESDDDDDDDDDESAHHSLTATGRIPKAVQNLSPDDPDYTSKLAAEEDKRRRNTAASARFRHKKRLREQILERTAKEMTEKSDLLEVRVRELEMEIKWLRGLIVEKDSRALDAAISSSGSLPISSSATSAALSVLSSSLSSASSLSKDNSRSDEGVSTATASKKRGKKSKA
ncbi:hypothetical protein BGZ76_008050 [Entomortierella beljakovae]|nr:hypothetical protein BGZ76_008050 [Entomortierella beljakovae]